jgi:hypothetical protein
MRMWREDAATNREPANASVPVTLRFDPEPPDLGFESSTAADPTLVSVLVTDRVSGVASGQIELSRAGSSTWQVLPTQRHGTRLVARIDDALLPAGAYLLRATARDHAGNQNSIDRLLDGREMSINLPLRIPTTMRAGVVTPRTVRVTIRRRGKRRTVRRKVEVLQPRTKVGFGRRVPIGGRLVDREGQALANAEVHVYARSVAAPEQLVGVVRTDSRGRYSFVARASATRTLRFLYPGTALMLPAEREVALLVTAASTIRVRPRSLSNGGTVRFSGRLRSLPTPAAGKLIELQVVLSGRWQTFRTTRTSPEGVWTVGYRFRRSCGLTRYRFRARLPAEAAYPFATGRTRPIAVRVRGAPCS